MDAGLEWLIDATGCSPDLLCDMQVLQEVCRQIVRDQNLHVVGEPVWHQFGGPGGVTGMLLLSESHLTCHTYPEHALATFNLYCCRRRAPWPWQTRLRVLLGARQVVVQSVVRGGELLDQNAAFQTSIEQARN